MHDLVIRGGSIIDGTGERRYGGDIAVDAGRITQIGTVTGPGAREIDADGALVTPGWVDIHTHYDGQATWDAELAPSSWHGVTTVVMGNCGVGFAPVRHDEVDFLIELMEGVEDIPGTALHEGIDWRWESFAEYLDVLDEKPRALDVAALVPHTALRAYVMGERAHDPSPTEAEVARMAGLVREAVEAGAAGFSTSRTILHSSIHGLVPGTVAAADEPRLIASAMRGTRGVFQVISDNFSNAADQEWFRPVLEAGVPITYSLAQSPVDPTAYRDALDWAAQMNSLGHSITAQTPPRPTGMLWGLMTSSTPLRDHPSFKPFRQLPIEAQIRKLQDPELRDRLSTEAPDHGNVVFAYLQQRFDQMYRLGDPPDYEPHPDTSAAAIARREGRAPQAVIADWLCEDDGRAFIFSPLGSYEDHDHAAIREMLEHPASVAGLADGGAHCAFICDASFPTYLLTHWTRDRTRGPQVEIERAVHKQTQATAAVYGMDDRGTIEVGKKADLNVIDHDNLSLHAPHLANDLPADSPRLLQRADGYLFTVCSGRVSFEDGEHTGELPGRLVRSGSG